MVFTDNLWTTGGESSTEKNTEETLYSEPQLRCDVRMDSNASFGLYTGEGSNVVVLSNPSYDVHKPNTEIDENQYELIDDTVEPNPSYGAAIGMKTKTKSTPDSNVTVIPNLAYASVEIKK